MGELAVEEVLSYLTRGERQKLALLEPETFALAVRIIAGMLARGFKVAIGQTARTVAQQLAALAAGTTSSGQKLSWHFLGRAIDFRRRLDNDTPDNYMDDKPDPTTGGDESFWIALYEESTAAGCRSLAYQPGLNGKPKRDDRGMPVKILLNGKTWDAGHVEYHGQHASLAAAVRAERRDLLAA